MPILRIVMEGRVIEDEVARSVFNYQDPSIISYIQETLHTPLPERVKIYRVGDVLNVVEVK